MVDGKPLMAGKRGLIMGVANDRSIAWGIAKAVAEHGAELAFTYQGEVFGKRVRPLAESLGSSIVLDCDVTDEASLDTVFATLAKRWERLDFVVHAIAFSDRERTQGPLCRHLARQFLAQHGDLLLSPSPISAGARRR